jgi:hypothetical protein
MGKTQHPRKPRNGNYQTHRERREAKLANRRRREALTAEVDDRTPVTPPDCDSGYHLPDEPLADWERELLRSNLDHAAAPAQGHALVYPLERPLDQEHDRLAPDPDNEPLADWESQLLDYPLGHEYLPETYDDDPGHDYAYGADQDDALDDLERELFAWPPALTLAQACQEMPGGFHVVGPPTPRLFDHEHYVRVWQVAKLTGRTSRDVMATLRDQGEYVRSPASKVALASAAVAALTTTERMTQP